MIDPRVDIKHIGRGDSFSRTLTRLMEKCDLNYYTIVEIGTTRGSFGGGPGGDGWATLAWSWFVNKYGGEVRTIDVSEECLDQCKLITKDYKNIFFHHMTGEEFLSSFENKIDLLYLDGSDDPNEMVEEYKIVKDKNLMSNNGLILLDDIPKNYLSFGKGQLVIPTLLGDGWKIVYHDTTSGVCQMLFERLYI